MKKTRMLAILVLALGLTTEVANADFTFGTPTNLGPTVSSSEDADPCISADGLELYFNSHNRPGGYSAYDMWVATRQTKHADWGTPVNLGPTVNSAYDHDPDISADGLSLFFSSTRPGGYGSGDLWVTTRATKNDPWGEPVNLGTTLNSSYDEADPSISADGLSLYFCDYEDRYRPGGYGGGDLWMTARATIEDAWGDPVNLGPLVNTISNDVSPSISADGLVLLFDSDRPGGYGAADLWFSTRKTIDDNWGTPVNLGPNVNSAYRDRNVSISGDSFSLYFDSTRPGGYGVRGLWQAPIIPIVDFNGDGIVDSDDMCIMVDYWGTNEPLCDIGPTPLGDGTVDVQDLIVLAEHLFEDVNDPTLIAHWPLDEAQGGIAYDNAGICDGTLLGVPVWQPDGGVVAGALQQFDGVDDYVSTDPVLNPANGAFSVVAWIMGGAPGQVVLSQADGSNWLCLDSVEGYLMTELKGSGRLLSPPLVSESTITDGDWHRIGLVWDGSHRKLYVDDVAVAEDTQTNLEASENGLYIGAGTAMETGSFWSGLIDDIRIYNRAVIP